MRVPNPETIAAMNELDEGTGWRVTVRVRVNPNVKRGGMHITFLSMRTDTPEDESAIRQPKDNIPPRDVIRTFMATRPTPSNSHFG